MKTISIRIDDNIYEEIEKNRGTESLSVYCRQLINDGLFTKNDSVNQGEFKRLEGEVTYLRTKLDEANSTIGELTRLLHQEQALHMQLQKQLMPAPQEITKKGWWQFWKK